MKQGIYQGLITHNRTSPSKNKFSYRYAMLFLDLDKIKETFDHSWLWSLDRYNLGSFFQKDYFRKTKNLKADLIHHLEKEKITGIDQIFILTTPRFFGFCYNPVSFYYCFKSGQLITIISDIHNTPWNERFAYTHVCKSNTGTHGFKFHKQFHVSPFMPMNIDYDWKFTSPSDVIVISMDNNYDDHKIFNATLKLKRKAITGIRLNILLLTYPLSPINTIIKIYWNALKLWVKRTPFYSHPKN
jgi:DUF1365 family protein